jgi:hypothetical protein
LSVFTVPKEKKYPWEFELGKIVGMYFWERKNFSSDKNPNGRHKEIIALLEPTVSFMYDALGPKKVELGLDYMPHPNEFYVSYHEKRSDRFDFVFDESDILKGLKTIGVSGSFIGHLDNFTKNRESRMSGAKVIGELYRSTGTEFNQNDVMGVKKGTASSVYQIKPTLMKSKSNVPGDDEELIGMVDSIYIDQLESRYKANLHFTKILSPRYMEHFGGRMDQLVKKLLPDERTHHTIESTRYENVTLEK